MSRKVWVTRDGAKTPYDVTGGEGRTLLESLEEKGAKMPFGCRSGACATCLVVVTAGADELSPVDPIEKDTLVRAARGAGSRLACRAKLRASTGADIAVELPAPLESDSIY